MLYRKQRIMRSAYSTAYKGTALLFDLRKEDKIVYAPIYVLLDTASEEDTRKLINPIILSKPKHFFADSPGKEFFIHLMSHNIVSPLKLAYKALRSGNVDFADDMVNMIPLYYDEKVNRKCCTFMELLLEVLVTDQKKLLHTLKKVLIPSFIERLIRLDFSIFIAKVSKIHEMSEMEYRRLARSAWALLSDKPCHLQGYNHDMRDFRWILSSNKPTMIQYYINYVLCNSNMYGGCSMMNYLVAVIIKHDYVESLPVMLLFREQFRMNAGLADNPDSFVYQDNRGIHHFKVSLMAPWKPWTKDAKLRYSKYGSDMAVALKYGSRKCINHLLQNGTKLTIYHISQLKNYGNYPFAEEMSKQLMEQQLATLASKKRANLVSGKHNLRSLKKIKK